MYAVTYAHVFDAVKQQNNSINAPHPTATAVAAVSAESPQPQTTKFVNVDGHLTDCSHCSAASYIHIYIPCLSMANDSGKVPLFLR